MTGRERVRRAIHFQGPDRVPFWGQGWEDFTPEVNLGPSLRPFVPLPEEELRKRVQGDYEVLTQTPTGAIVGSWKDKPGGEVVAPAFEDWAQADALPLPDTDDPRRYEKAAAVFAADTAQRYHLVVCPGLTTGHTSTFYGMRGMQRYLMDMADHQDEMIAFQEKRAALDVRCLELWKQAGADGVLTCDDLGTQDRLLVSPLAWRRVFKPFQRRFLEVGHRLGLDMFLHSCGYIWDLIPDLIEVGWDVLNIDQPNALGIDRLAAAFGGRICFYCPVDIQTTLPTGDRQKIEAEARHLIQALGKFNGGFMAKDYGPTPEARRALGTPEEWAAWAREAFRKYGVYAEPWKDAGGIS